MRHALWARPSRPRARHLRPDSLLQRGGALIWGPAGRCCRCRCGSTRRSRSCPAYLPGLPLRIIIVALAGRGCALPPRDAHARRHADPRRRVEPRDGGGARRQHPAPVHAGVRPRRRARRPRRLMQAPILTVSIGMGENILILAFVVIIIGGIGSIRGALLRRDHRRHRRYGGAGLPARSAASRAGLALGGDGRAGDVVDADLPDHDDRAGVARADCFRCDR